MLNKKIDIKNCICYYFDNIISAHNLNLDNNLNLCHYWYFLDRD